MSEEDLNSSDTFGTNDSNEDNDELKYKLLLKDLTIQIQKGNDLIQILDPLTKQGSVYKSIFEVISKEFEKIKVDIKASKQLNTNFSKDLIKSKKEIDDFLSEINSLIHQVKQVNKEVLSIKETASRRAKVINNLNIEASEKKIEITKLKNSIKKIFSSLNKVEVKVNNLFSEIQNNKNKSDKDIKELKSILIEANKKSKELETFYKQGKKSFDHINTQKRKIDELERISNEKTNKISAFFEKIFSSTKEKKSMESDIHKTMVKIQEQQSLVDELLENSNSLRLSGAFKEKEKELQIKLEKWEKWIFRLVAGTVLLNILIIFFPLTLKIQKLSIIEHTSLISPLILLLFFVLLEHARVKKILDIYSFKYIESFTMPAFTELFENKGESQKSIEFMEETIKDIYTNPSDKVNETSKSNILDYVLDFMKDSKNYFSNLGKIELPKIEGSAKLGNMDIAITSNNNETKKNT